MSIKRQLLLILPLLLLLLIAQIISYAGGQRQDASASLSSPATNTAVKMPTLTASDTIAEQEKHPISALIAYVDSGFTPPVTRIRAGQTVRFIDNSSTHDLWVAASGDHLYPHTQNGCGSSDLDTCAPLKPGEFWQFTFTQKGTWQFVNNLDKTKQGTVIVQ